MNQSNEKELYRQEGEILDRSEAFMGFLTECGGFINSKTTAEKFHSAEKKQVGKNYHNTLVLLRQYRTIVWMMEYFPEVIAEELEKPFEGIDMLLEQVDMEMALGNQRLKTRMEGIQKSRVLLDRVNEALTVLKKKPDDGERLYQVIYLTYIAPEQLSHTELLDRLGMSSRHYYRLRQQAIIVLSIRLWTAPTKDVDIWLEMLAMLEDIE